MLVNKQVGTWVEYSEFTREKHVPDNKCMTNDDKWV